MIVRAILLASIAAALPLPAQIRASEMGTVSQMIDGTRLALEYSRPRSRGRDPIFGTKAVKWNEVWTPGANWATTLDVSKNIKLNGHPVKKGKYGVWLVVRQQGDWTMVLDPDWHRYHMNPPDSAGRQVRFAVRPEAIPFTDVLIWSFPELRPNGGKLAMQWERVRISADVEVEPSLVMTLPAADAVPYLGEYTFTERDSTGKVSKVSSFTVTHEEGMLKGRWTPDDPYMKKFALIRIAPDWFAPGVYDENGVLYEVLKPDVVVEFKRANGRADSFVMRTAEDEIWGTAARKR
ncbi:MAG TPA: DUF2911 domain-containing protein [Gemmatimonadaceae bacterium]|nr:DUF2911 domain-containing protein [Gemmatimonadaceae bacterium]